MYTALAVIFLFWIALTILNQIDGKEWLWLWRLRQLDPCQMIPRWTFFGPNPGSSAHHVLFRDETTDGKPAQWNELYIQTRRRVFHCVWNPRKRVSKVVTDCILAYAMAFGDHPDRAILVEFHLPYLTLLHRVMSEPRPPTTIKRQFAVVAVTGFQAKKIEQIIFLSRPYAF